MKQQFDATATEDHAVQTARRRPPAARLGGRRGVTLVTALAAYLSPSAASAFDADESIRSALVEGVVAYALPLEVRQDEVALPTGLLVERLLAVPSSADSTLGEAAPAWLARLNLVPELHLEAAWMDPWGAMTGQSHGAPPYLKVGRRLRVPLVPGHRTYKLPLADGAGGRMWALRQAEGRLVVEVEAALVDAGGRALGVGARTSAYELDILRLEVAFPAAALRTVRRAALRHVVAQRGHLRNSLRAACRLRRLASRLDGVRPPPGTCPAEELALTPTALAAAAAVREAVAPRLDRLEGAHRQRVEADLARVGAIEADLADVMLAVDVASAAAWLGGETDIYRLRRKIGGFVQRRERQRFDAWAQQTPEEAEGGDAILVVEAQALRPFRRSFWQISRSMPLISSP